MIYKAGVYVRLSRDDEREGESMSIENQKLILEKYVAEQGWNLIDIYSDDGYTGTNFERPAFKRMIEDVKSKRVNVVIVKDLSRFGRNYIQVGQYTDYLFPSVGCRFIALNDGVDTLNTDNDIMPFKNLFNEFYSRDISKKVKSAKKARAQDGKFLGCCVAMGYRKDPTNPHSLIIDEQAEPIIQRLFSLRRQGLSYRKIASMFNEENLITPRDYYYQQMGRENPRKVNHKWSDITVKQILLNEVYIGNIVQFKTAALSYKDHRQIKVPPENWIRCEGTHEPLVDRETWDIVQSLGEKSKSYRTSSKDSEVSLFSGMLECADCGTTMKLSRDYNRRKDGHFNNYHAYICSSYARGGKYACSTHRTKLQIFSDLVKADIQKQANRILQDEAAVERELMRRKNADMASGQASLRGHLQTVKRRLDELSRLIEKSYEEMVRGDIPRDILLGLIEKYQQERQEKTMLANSLAEQLASVQETEHDIREWIKLMKRHMAVEKIDRELVMRLIDKIIVGQKTTTDGVEHQDITISYRLVGALD